MRAAVKSKYVRGNLLSDEELAALAPAVGELMTYQCPREPGGPMRNMAGIGTPAKAELLKPIIEPRLVGIGIRGFVLRGIEELKTERGWVYVLQEWVVEEVR